MRNSKKAVIFSLFLVALILSAVVAPTQASAGMCICAPKEDINGDNVFDCNGSTGTAVDESGCSDVCGGPICVNAFVEDDVPSQRDQNEGSPALRAFLKGAGYNAPTSDMTCGINAQGQEVCVPSNDVRRYIVDIIRFVLTGVGFLFFALLVYAGYLWATAGGNDEAVKKAQSIATKAIIGFAVILAAWAITTFITTFLQQSVFTQ